LPKHAHAIVWIDHHEARIIYFSLDASEETVVHPDHPPRSLASKAGSREGRRHHEDPEFYADVTAALAEVPAFLVVGPASAKTELVKYLHRHAPRLIEHLAAVETMDRATDSELLARARHEFKRIDDMRPRF